MRVSLEPLAAGALGVRAHREGGLGDEYTWCCVVEPHGDFAILKLAERAPTRAEIRALRVALNGIGITRVRWERRRDGKSRWTREFR